ncbi:MAG TPA: ABC transporter permease [Burkholderiaceae bacterium]|nr:ABC transporter permease [Burkholderiaceae bacterium]
MLILHRLVTLIRKELQAQLRDPQSRRLLLMPVLLQLLLFPFAATLEVKNNTLAVHDLDGGAAATELVQRFAQARAFPRLVRLHGDGEVREVLDDQRALLVVQFPADFSRAVAAGRPARLQVLLDGRRSNAAQVAYGYVQDIVAGYAAERGLGPPSVIALRHWFNPNLDSKWYLLPGLVAIITTLGCMIVTAMSVAREREEGTFEQLLVSPLTPALIMVGKAVPALIIAVVQASIILAGAMYAYRIPFQGSIPLLYAGILLYGVALVGIGLLISSLCSTQQQAFLGVFGFLMPAILLSGFLSPIENMPEPLRSMTWLDPVRHFLVVSRGLYLKGFDPHLVAINCWPLLVIAAVSLSLAYVIFVWRSQ